MLTPEEVDHIATLSRLDISDEEREEFRTQLSSVLDYVAALQTVPTDGVEPMAHVASVPAPLREDVVQGCEPAERDALVAAFPESDHGQLKVKGVFS